MHISRSTSQWADPSCLQRKINHQEEKDYHFHKVCSRGHRSNVCTKLFLSILWSNSSRGLAGRSYLWCTYSLEARDTEDCLWACLEGPTAILSAFPLRLSCRSGGHSVLIILSCFCMFISSRSSNFACKLNKRVVTWSRKSQDVVPDMSRLVG